MEIDFQFFLVYKLSKINLACEITIRYNSLL